MLFYECIKIIQGGDIVTETFQYLVHAAEVVLIGRNERLSQLVLFK